jgi:cell division protein FtsQ
LRSLPHKITVHLVEREPVARWQHEDKTMVIDAEGFELTAAKVEQFPNLPLIVGDVEPKQTEALLSLLSEYPMVASRLKAAVRVAERRWNLHLQPNITVRLPEDYAQEAMARLTRLIKDQKITERDVKAIDLRLPEKVYIEPVNQDKPSDSGE